MSHSQALSDDQVGQELRKMTAFIKQEADEKAHEIEMKADQEFAMEKAKLVREEQGAIDTQYEKKSKAAAMSQQITASTVSNKTRLRVLSARQELLDGIFETAAKKLPEVTKDKARYETILKNLVLEGFYALNESNVLVRTKKADAALAKKAVEAASKEYTKNTNKEISASVDENNSLEDDLAGGVSIVGSGGKIDINNTLDERLRLLQDNALPAIRTTLFGKNENRKFYD
ncbi:V-ATPase V1 sector subunit E [Pseudogymnoascus australis]